MKMRYIMLLLITITFISSCSVDDSGNSNDSASEQITIPQWNLINVQGKTADIKHNFKLGDIVWTFDQFTGTLSISNNNTNKNLEDGLASGEYTFIFTENTSKELFLIIDGNDYGKLIFSGENNSTLTIDQSYTVKGFTADNSYIYTFSKTTTTIEI